MQKRIENKYKKVGNNLNFDAVCNFESLYNSAFKAAKGVRWKISVQRYLLSALTNTVKLKRRLEKQKRCPAGFYKVCYKRKRKTP